ncbi:MAG: hypothetical protein QM589_13820 [Thermomicrobiales bacterium]
MLPRKPPQRERFSNRQAILFILAVVIGLIGGWFTDAVAGGMMLGGIVGATAILLPGLRDRPDNTTNDGRNTPHDTV